ncbi:MAG: hypothetical protein U0165_02695 [Polyangiaceae bacterium]
MSDAVPSQPPEGEPSSNVPSTSPSSSQRWWDASWVRGLITVPIALVGLAYFASKIGAVYPVSTWLFWSIAPLWAWVAVLSLAWVSMGSMLLEQIHPRRSLPLLETTVLSAALGSVAFVTVMYVAGASVCSSSVCRRFARRVSRGGRRVRSILSRNFEST